MKSCILSLILFFSTLGVIAQGIVVDSLGVAVNESEVSADPSAILDISSNSKGVLIPRLTTAEIQAIQNPAEGLLVFNANDQVFMYYQNSLWHTIAELDDIPVDGDSDSSNEIQALSSSLSSGQINLSNSQTTQYVRLTAGNNIDFTQGLKSEGIVISSPDSDNDATNEKISSASVVGDYLRIIEGGVTRNIPLSSIQSYWTRNSGSNYMYPSDVSDRLKIGGNQIETIYSTNPHFGSRIPMLDIQTGSSTGSYEELVCLNHRYASSTATPRRLGVLMAIGGESSVSTNKSGGVYVESVSSWANNPRLRLFVGAYAPLTINYNNRVGINMTNPNRTLDVNGTAGGTYAWAVNSDARLKENVETINGALNLVENMRGVFFTWKSDSVWVRPEGRQVGFIAQEVKQVLPEVVSDTSVDNSYYSVTYSFITPVLAEAIKELKVQKDTEIEALNGELEAKQTELEALQTELEELRNTVEVLQSTVETMQE